jgi:mRNA interferase MazF
MTVRRGEIYWVDFDPVKGSELGGVRPALVVQQDLGNTHSPTTVVAAITRTIPPKPYPFTVFVSQVESGLREPSLVNCSQLFTVQQKEPGSRLRAPKGEANVRPIGRLSPEKLAEVDGALKYNLGLT